MSGKSDTDLSSSNSNNAKKAYTIRSTRPLVPINKMDPILIENTWIELSNAIDQIYQKNASHLFYEQLYRIAYNLILAKQGEFLYSKVAEKIKVFVAILLEKLCELPNENLLYELSIGWDYHKVVMAMVGDVLMYLDKTHVKQHRKLPVYTLSLKIFRDVILYHSDLRERLRSILLECILIERGGGMIDKDVIRNILAMYVDVCVDTVVNNNNSVLRIGNVYEEEFEQHFLVATREFYKNESEQFLSQNTVPDYLRKVEERINQENLRIQQYLSKTSERQLKAVLDSELISAHANVLLDIQNSNLSINNNNSNAFVALMRENKLEDLKRLFQLLSRVPSTLDILRDCLGEYTKQCGIAIIQSTNPTKIDNDSSSSSTNVNTNTNSTITLSIEFVKQILELKDKMDLIVTESFNSDKRAFKKLQDSFDNFINMPYHNSNTAHANSNNSRFNAALYLAIYLDEIMKNGIKDSVDTDIEIHIDKALIIFRHITDKDLFENYYKQYLSKRLLQFKSHNDEIEKLVLSKLKAECGYQYTSKLEGMFNDINISKSLLDQYKSENNNNVEVDIQVLTAGYWPLQTTQMVRLPQPISVAMENFNSFYLSKNNGKKLAWMLHLGSVDIKANYPLGKRDLNVSTYQACILYCFNSNMTLSLNQIRELCDLPEIEFRRHLLSLCTPKLKILKKSPASKGIQDDDTFTFNDEFTSKFKRIKVPLISIKEVSPELIENRNAGFPTAVEEDRKNLIDAAVVRIMKARRRFSHYDLVAEVTRQLSHRFLPNPASIKNRIESLIERDYLERDKDDIKVYCYLA